MLVQIYFKQIYQVNLLKEFQNSTTWCERNSFYVPHEIHAFQEIVHKFI